MKKLTIVTLLCSTLLFSACSTDKTSESADSTAKQENKMDTTASSKKAKEVAENKQAEEVEKKKQEEIAKQVSLADQAMKASEANPTDETVSAARKAFEGITGGNDPLKKRLDAVSAKLEAIKQQTATTENQAQQQPSNPDPDFIDADGNGWDDRSPFNDPAAREDNRRREAEAQQQFWDQQNQQQQQNDAVAQRDQFASEFEAQHGRQPTSGEIQSQWLQEQGIE